MASDSRKLAGLLERLRPKERRGSKPRCHILTHGSAKDVAARLTALAATYAIVSPVDRWMPDGFDDLEEAQLHRSTRLLDPKLSEELRSWGLAPASQNAKSPHFDIASTCKIGGSAGLLLVEAKAHDEELHKEASGRILKLDSSKDRLVSHQTIGTAIETARMGLVDATSLSWAISRDNRYQMSNRFAWAWKLTELGVPVVLVYLGFLKATEMADRGKPFRSHSEWEELVRSHSEPLFPFHVWNKQSRSNGQPLIPIIKSLELSL